MAEVAYYSWENLDTGEYEGLLRFSEKGLVERASATGWQPAQTEPKALLFPGADGPDLIPFEKARELAARFGVQLT
jgi:hypothetical protein